MHRPRMIRAAGALLTGGLLALSLTVTLTPSNVTAARPVEGNELLPNLKAFPAQDVQLATANGRTYLRFSTLSGNLTTPQGASQGALELRAGDLIGTDKQKVWQRVSLDGRGYRDYLVGEMTYHPEHFHFHLDQYAVYELQPANGSGAAGRIGQKTSFCIMDTTRLDASLGPRRGAYSTCSNRVQGMSQGWGDRYGWQLAGQEIDVTGLPEGLYRLTITIDPQHKLRETTTADNTSSVLVELAGGTVTVR
jgi:hypothetical protein